MKIQVCDLKFEIYFFNTKLRLFILKKHKRIII